jgi:hypothetical protein
MAYGNITVVFMVISVASCVLGIAFAAIYFLDKAVNQGER